MGTCLLSRRASRLLAAIFFTAMPCAVAEGVPHLAADVNTRLPSPLPPYHSTARGADPRSWTALGDKALFVAYTGSTGSEPWVTDGTSAGTFQLADTCPGACGYPFQFLGVARGVAFFVTGALPGLWRTDGTVRGTFRLLDGTSALRGVVAESGIFFAGGYGYEEDLWHSDGTVAGTGPLADLGPGPVYTSPFVLAGSRALFGTTYPQPKVWSSDGTPAGTHVLIAGGVGEAVSAGERAYLIVHTEADGQELWSSDGTAAGTVRISNFAPPAPFPSGNALIGDGGALFVHADDGTHGPELFRLAANGQLLRVSDTPLGPAGFAVAGSRRGMTARDAEGILQLWVGDPGTIAQPLLSGCREDCPRFSDSPLVSVGARVVFVATGAAGRELWTSDGTAAGTYRLTDFCAGGCDSSVSIVGRQLGLVLFAGGARDDLDVGLWATDGTPAGTREILDFGGRVPFDGLEQLFGSDGATVGTRAFFAAADAQWGLQPWVTDGTLAGTRQIALLEANGIGSAPADLGATAYGAAFVACDGERVRAYGTDGTPTGTEAFTVPAASCDDVFRERLLGVARDDRYYVIPASADDPALWSIDLSTGSTTQLVSLDGHGFNGTRRLQPWGPHGAAFLTSDPATFAQDLWVTDGTSAGTRLIGLPLDLVHPSDLTVVGDRIYFVALRSSGWALWTSDGTAEGTAPLVPEMRAAAGFVRLGGVTYFLGDGALWRSDGTVAGTTPIAAGPMPYYTAHDLVAFGGALYFFARLEAQSARYGLWRSDGTAAGTQLVVKLPFITDGIVSPSDLTATPSALFFSSRDPAHGRELWRSDGTAAGTTLVRDVVPGAESSMPSGLTAAPDGSLFFVAYDGVHGFELWHSDGTAAGTRMVQDIAPGPLSSQPDQLTVSGGQLFFTADDALHGREPWVLPLAGSAACAPTETRLCLLGGRYAVEATWRDHAGRNGIGTAVPLTSDTGTFWFFGPANLEVAIKVLDGTPLNGHRWVFYGALSDVEYTLTVTDTATGAVRRYVNPRRILASVGDTSAFGPNGATGASAASVVTKRSNPLLSPSRGKLSPAVACSPTAERLCFGSARFTATVRWKAFDGSTGVGHTLPLAADTGAFWFFGADNIELLLKVLDGTPVNGHWWVLFGALSSVEYWVTVTDATTGDSVEYHNPSGRLGSVADTSAFPR